MAEELTGEEKLRIVLESIIRSVPKAEQCEKYNVSEDDFEAWRKHLMSNGGKIFEPNYGAKTRESTPPSGASTFVKIVLALSVLANLAIVGGAVAWKLGWLELGTQSSVELAASTSEQPSVPVRGAAAHNSDGGIDDKPAETLESFLASKSLDTADPSSIPPVPGPERNSTPSPEPKVDFSSNTKPEAGFPRGPEFSVDSPTSLPLATVSVPRNDKEPLFSGVPGMSRPTFEVNAFGIRTPGRIVVFVMDVSDYMTRGGRTQGKFRELKKQLGTAISGLSVNSHFNLLLFRNLREIEMLGKTVIPANPNNKGLALKWLNDIGEPWENKEETRNRHYDERDIFDKPPKGAVGPWYALYCAINYDSDAVFIITGDCSSMRPKDFSVVDWDDLDVAQGDHSAEWEEWSEKTKILRLTAVKWLQTVKKEGELLPAGEAEMQALALSRLQLPLPPKPSGSPDSSWPWREVYEKFRSALRTETTPLPIVHFVVTLPDGATWSDELTKTVREFTEGVEGKLTFYEPTMP